MAYENMSQEELEQLGYEQEMARLLGKDPSSALSNDSEKVKETVEYADGTKVEITNPNTPSSSVQSREQFVQDVKNDAVKQKKDEDKKLADEAFANAEKEGQVYGKSVAEWEDMQRANGKLYEQQQTDAANAKGEAAQAKALADMEEAMAQQDWHNNNPRESGYNESFNTGDSVFEEQMVVPQDGDSVFGDSAVPLQSSEVPQAYNDLQIRNMKKQAEEAYAAKEGSTVTYTNPNGSSAQAVPGSDEAIALEGLGYIEGGVGQASLLDEGVTGSAVLEDRKEDKKTVYIDHLMEKENAKIEQELATETDDSKSISQRRREKQQEAKKRIDADLNPSPQQLKDSFDKVNAGGPVVKALFEKAVDKASNAQDLLDNEEALKTQLGEGVTKDLMKIAFAALFGGGRGALRAYGRDEERKKKQADKMAEIEQKAINKQNAAQTKAHAKLNKESRAKAEKDKDSLMSSISSMLTKDQKINHLGGVNGLAATLQTRGYNFGNYQLREAFHEATKAGVKDSEKWGWDSEKAKGSIEGHFFERIGVLTADGMVSKDSNDLKESKAKQRSEFSMMQFKHKEPKEFSTKWLNEFRDEKARQGGEDGGWMWKNNFAGWAIEEIKKKQAADEKLMNK